MRTNISVIVSRFFLPEFLIRPACRRPTFPPGEGNAPWRRWGYGLPRRLRLLAMTEEGTIPGKKNRETITEMLVRIVRRHCRPRNDVAF